MTVIAAAKVPRLSYTLLLYFPPSITRENLVMSYNNITIICSINLAGKPLAILCPSLPIILKFSTVKEAIHKSEQLYSEQKYRQIQPATYLGKSSVFHPRTRNKQVTI